MFGDVSVAPSILSADFTALGADVSLVADAGADWIHVDVMDGHFVPNLTIGPAHVEALKRVTDVPLDVHLMVDNPAVQVPWYLDAGADCLTVHIEAAGAQAADILASIRARGCLAGISLNPETPPEALADVLPCVDVVLVMSVHPGFGGQTFIEATLARLDRIVELCRSAGVCPILEVDGGINATTAAHVVEHGADMLVAGSSVFGACDPAAALRSIRHAGR